MSAHTSDPLRRASFQPKARYVNGQGGRYNLTPSQRAQPDRRNVPLNGNQSPMFRSQDQNNGRFVHL